MIVDFYIFDNDGKEKLEGSFSLSANGKKVLFSVDGNTISDSMFLKLFGDSYFANGVLIKLSDPKVYLKNLIYRFSGRSWAKERKSD